MKLSQLIESFVISNDEFEDYLNRATEQLVSELSSGKNPRDAVHDLALTFADQHNKSYDAYQRMADSLEARMHTLEMNSPTDMMNGPEDDMGMGSVDEPEMMSDPMGNMEMNTPASSEMPSDSDMEDYSAVMGEGRMSDQLIDDAENMTKKEFEKKHGKEAARDMFEESINEDSDEDKARQRALAKADEPERGEERKKVSLKKAPWEESVNEGDDTVKVVFRKFDNGDVIALFPEEEQGRGLITSYMEIGQHGDASKSLITDLEPASKEEYAKLAAELKRIGYDIVMAESVNEAAECKYCGGDCPNDEEHACDGYLGDIDGLYEAKASVIDQLQSIVDDRQAKSIKFDDGSSKVDMFTASAITQVYANVNDANKAKIEKMLNSRAGLIKVAKFAMGALKEGKLNEALPLAAPLLGLVGRAVAGIAGRAATGGVAKGVAKGVGKAAKAANVARKIGPAISTAKAFVKGAQDVYLKDPYTKATGRHLESTEKKADDIMKSAINKVNKK